MGSVHVAWPAMNTLFVTECLHVAGYVKEKIQLICTKFPDGSCVYLLFICSKQIISMLHDVT